MNAANRYAFPQAVLIIGRIKDNSNMACIRIGTDQHGQTISRQHRHINVEQNKIGLEPAHEVYHTETLVLRNYLESFVFKKCFRDIEKHFIIVN